MSETNQRRGRISARVPSLLLINLALAAHTVAGDVGTGKKPSPQRRALSGELSSIHREILGDPWMPRSAEAPEGVVIRCEPVVRGPYKSVQVNVDLRGCNIPGDAANEPSIAVDPTDPRKIVIGWRQFDTIDSNFRQAGHAYSHDAGGTWVFPGSLTPGVFGSDPVLAAGPEGEFFYLSINFVEMRLFRSFDGGVSWDAPIQVSPSFIDKPWMAVDLTDGIGRGNIYIGAENLLYRSTNSGLTFIELLDNFPRLPTLSVAPDGTLYMVGPRFDTFTRSLNAQDPDQTPVLDFTTFVEGVGILGGGGPNPGGLLGQIWVATDHSGGPTRGNVYLLASWGTSLSEDLDITFVRSIDGGLTWTAPRRVNDDPEGNGAWQWFGTMSVAPNGRIDAVWNDTRNYLGAPDGRLNELFYAYSTDAGETWSDNIPVSPVFDSHVGWPQQNKIGDYYHMTSDNLGANVAYAATFNGEQDVYFLRIGPHDCNGNEVPDQDDIASATSSDCNANAVPDECEFRGDWDGDRLTTLRDVAGFQRCFTGATPGLADPCCGLFDLDGGGTVDHADLAPLIELLSGP